MLIFMPGILRYAVGVLLVISFAFTSRKIYLGGGNDGLIFVLYTVGHIALFRFSDSLRHFSADLCKSISALSFA